MENVFEKIRLEVTAALARRDIEAADNLVQSVFGRLPADGRLSEAAQKAINQMLAAIKRLSPKNIAGAGQALQSTRARLKKALARIARVEVRHIDYTGYTDWRRGLGLDEDRYRSMLLNVAACQLSVGCSNFCRRCNEWALAGVRRHFAFDAAQRILRDLHAGGNDGYALYSASDPLDYRCGERTVADLLQDMQKRGHQPQYGLLTKIPRGSESLAAQFLEEGADLAVSLTEKNRARVARIEGQAGKKFRTHHDTVDLLIPAGLDEDFATVKSSITDNYGIEITPEGASMVIPTFTSALNPTGQCRLPITADTGWFIKKKVGREALPVAYFKPLTVIRTDGSEGVLGSLLKPQVENILLDSGNRGATPPGMMDLEEYFKTFDPAVVRHRKKLASVAIENLRRQVYGRADSSGCNLQALDRRFQRKRQAYLDACDPAQAARLKRKAFGYLLAAAADYLHSYPAEREIVRFLRRADAAAFSERLDRGSHPTKVQVDDLLADPKTNSFDSFSCLLLRLLEDPEDKGLAEFLEANAADYDSDFDRFV